MHRRTTALLVMAALVLSGLGLQQIEALPPGAGEAYGVRWTGPQPIAPGELQEYPDVAVDGTGQAWVSWIGMPDGREHVFLRTYRGVEAGPVQDIGLPSGLQFAPRVLATGDRLWIAWSARQTGQSARDKRWQLYVRAFDGGIPEPAEVVSGPAEDAIRPALGLDAAGEPWVAWESRVGHRFRVMARALTPHGARPPAIEVSGESELSLRPSVTAAPEGGVYVAWDQYEHGEYQVFARRLTSVASTPIPVSDEPGTNVGASAFTDANGRVWIGYASNSDLKGGQVVGRALRLKAIVEGKVREVAGGLPPRIFTAQGRLDAIEFPTVRVDPEGRVWVFARRGQGWIAFRYEGSRWSPPIDLSDPGWGGRGRELRAAWSPEGFHLVSRRLHILAHQLLVPSSSPARQPALKGDAELGSSDAGRPQAGSLEQAASPAVATTTSATTAPEGGAAPEPATSAGPSSAPTAAVADTDPHSAPVTDDPPAVAPADSSAGTTKDTPTPVHAPTAEAPILTSTAGPVASKPVSAAATSEVDPTASGAAPGSGSGKPTQTTTAKTTTAKTTTAKGTKSKKSGSSSGSKSSRSKSGKQKAGGSKSKKSKSAGSGSKSQSNTASKSSRPKSGTSRSGPHTPSGAAGGGNQPVPQPVGGGGLILADGVGTARPALRSSQLSRSDKTEDPPVNRQPGIYFGDLHTHTWISDGTGDADEIYTRSRDRYQYDFVALTDHDLENGNRILPSEWAYLKLLAEFFYEVDRFVTFVSYEWTSLSYPKGAGHRNVYFPGDDAPLFNNADVAPDSRSLFELLKTEGAIASPHHIGWTGTDWENHDPEVQRMVEICSVHGAFEKPGNKPVLPRAELAGMFVRDGLLRGLKFGLLGGSDGHGFPWHYGVSRKEDVWRTGLTGLIAPALNRDALFTALRNRQSIATSGAAIVIRMTVNGAPIGSELEVDRGPEFEIRVEGTAPLKEVALVRDGEDIQTYAPDGPRFDVHLTDDPSPGQHFYYLRAIQQDREVAWASPIWVELKGRILVGPPDP